RLGPALAEPVTGVGRQVVVAIDGAGGPADHDLIDAAGRAEPEMEPAVAGGLIAAAPDPLGHLATAAADDRDARPDGVTVRDSPLQAEGHGMAATSLVAEVGEGRVE